LPVCREPFSKVSLFSVFHTFHCGRGASA
jgi:hypothetical protein